MKGQLGEGNSDLCNLHQHLNSTSGNKTHFRPSLGKVFAGARILSVGTLRIASKYPVTPAPDSFIKYMGFGSTVKGFYFLTCPSIYFKGLLLVW